jgi:hypothetical protein
MKLPIRIEPAQKPIKLFSTIMSVASNAPATPIMTPSAKPNCRPARRINSDAGMVVSIVAVNCSAKGSVDNAGSGAKD